MSEWVRKFLKTPQGKIFGLCFVAVFAIVAFFQFRSLASDGTSAFTGSLPFIDSTTGKVFYHTIQAGESIPLVAPSGQRTGYPAEVCNWTKDGTVSSTDTPVLLNLTIGKPGPTFCPDCGRLVTPRNERAVAGRPAPPTEEEYLKMHKGKSQNAE